MPDRTIDDEPLNKSGAGGPLTEPARASVEARSVVKHAVKPIVERVALLAAAGGELLELLNAKPDRALSQRIGAACRASPERLLVWQIDDLGGDRVPAEVFFSFGFRRVLECIEDGRHHVVHEYRLAEYKSPPDWLNSRFWANPERFELDTDDYRQLPPLDEQQKD